MKTLIKNWKKSLNNLSGNLTTNEYMPDKIKKRLLEEDFSLSKKIIFDDIKFPKLNDKTDSINGLNILAGLQKIHKKDCITLFRAIRFPTFKRIYEIIFEKGFAIDNYEQERILSLYKNKDYLYKRKEIKQDKNFWVQPQERVVNGIPFFSLVNDALQIHRAFRCRKDKVLICVVHIPMKLIKNNRIKLIANTAIDLDYNNSKRDFEIKDFKINNQIDYGSLRLRGIDLHEFFVQGLPWNLSASKKIGIEQEFFLLDIYEINKKKSIKKLIEDTKLLKKNQFFLHGFFGDQNVFGRNSSKYLPEKCYRINKNESS